MARTRRVDCNAAGIRRRRHGRGFSYEWASGGKVDEPHPGDRHRRRGHPAVARSSYIDPRVFDRFDAGETIRPALSRIVDDADETGFPERERIERAVLRLLAS
jgi:DNA topoisomerase IB